MHRGVLVALALMTVAALAAPAALLPAGQPRTVALNGLSPAELADLGVVFAEPPAPAGQAVGRALMLTGVRPADLPAAVRPLPEVTVAPGVADALALSLLAPGGRVLDTRLLVANQVNLLPPNASCGGSGLQFCRPLLQRGPSVWWVVVVRGILVEGAGASGAHRRLVYFMDPQERGAFRIELPA